MKKLLLSLLVTIGATAIVNAADPVTLDWSFKAKQTQIANNKATSPYTIAQTTSSSDGSWVFTFGENGATINAQSGGTTNGPRFGTTSTTVAANSTLTNSSIEFPENATITQLELTVGGNAGSSKSTWAAKVGETTITETKNYSSGNSSATLTWNNLSLPAGQVTFTATSVSAGLIIVGVKITYVESETPKELGEIVATCGETVFENDGTYDTLMEGDVLNFSCANAEKITVTNSANAVIASANADNCTWTATPTEIEELTVTATLGETSKSITFMIAVAKEAQREAGLKFPAEDYTAELGSKFDAPVLTNPYNLTVTYSSDDTKVATVDSATGAVTLVGEGMTIINAKSDATDKYLAGEASYTLTVSKPTVATPTFSIENGATVYPGTVLTISCATEGAQILYSINNEEKIETAPVTITLAELGNYTVTAFASLDGYKDSADAEVAFEVVEQPAVPSNVYEIVTSDTQLVAGGKYVLISKPFASGKVNYGTYLLGAVKSSNAGFEAIKLDGSATTIEDSYDLGEISNYSELTLTPSETTGEWYITISGQYLDGSKKSTLKLGTDPKSIKISIDNNGNSILKTGTEGTKDLTVQFFAQNSSNKPANEAFNAYSSSQHPVVLYKKAEAGPVAPAVPEIEVDGVVVEDLTKAISLNKEVKTVRIIAAEGHHVYHKHVLEASEEEEPQAINALAAEADDFTHVEDNVAEVQIDRNGTLHFYAAHPTTGAQSDVATVRFINDHTTEIAEIDATNGAAQWFDLQGRRVNAPVNGVFIKVAAGKAVKVAL